MSSSRLAASHYAFDDDYRSRYTVRDLRDLARSSTVCPLRVIALIDFDAFYAQCETVRLGLPGDQPLAVQQWNICIAVNYAAKAAGVKRIVTPEDAKLLCPEIVLQHVPTWREGDSTWAYRSDVRQHMATDKAALDPYRLQSRKAFELIKGMLPPSPLQRVEKASIDEVFLDLSAQVHALLLTRYAELSIDVKEAGLDSPLPLPSSMSLNWYSDKVVAAADVEVEVPHPDWDDVAINIGCEIVRGIRRQIYEQLRYTCSAGIAHNKTVAKLAAGHNKPNQQTVVRSRAISAFYSGYKFTKIRGLGRKFGRKAVQAFGTDQITELLMVPLDEMRTKLGSESGTWIYNVIRGDEYSEVVERTLLQSMLAAKTFVPKAKDLEQVEKWLRIFAGDLLGRLQEQDAASSHRRPRVIALHHAIDGRFGPTRSKQMQIPLGADINAKLLFDLSRELLIQLSREGPTWPCLGVSVNISDFEDGVSGNRDLTTFFAPQAPRDSSINDEDHAVEEVKGNTTLVSTTKRKKGPRDRECATVEVDPYVFSETKRTKTDMTQNDEHLYCCPKCSQQVGHAEVLEHLDWHVADELQNS